MSGEELKLNEVEAGKSWSEPVLAEPPEMDTVITTGRSSRPVMLTHMLPLSPSFSNTSAWPNVTMTTAHEMKISLLWNLFVSISLNKVVSLWPLRHYN